MLNDTNAPWKLTTMGLSKDHRVKSKKYLDNYDLINWGDKKEYSEVSETKYGGFRRKIYRFKSNN